MNTPVKKVDLREQLLARLEEARARSDELFQLARREALYERPIPERHRIVFYIGHLEAFDWNLICRGTFGMDSFREEFDRLFAFGIDPTNGSLPTDKPSDWPRLEEIDEYNRGVRLAVDASLRNASFTKSRQPFLEDGLVFNVAIEHRLMHVETLAYMLCQLPVESKLARAVAPEPPRIPMDPAMIEIPAGKATLGRPRAAGAGFGWDNEFEEHQVHVPDFTMDRYPISNVQFLEFVRAGGYGERTLWSETDWQWKEREGLCSPRFWVRRGAEWYYRAMFAEIPLPLEWPVYVSHAEAAAYARWAGKSLPTEAQWHRAAYGTPDGRERDYPWGNETPNAQRGNFGFQRWDPTLVQAHPAGSSAFGVADLLGNGWEWTSTPFAPFPGFQPFPFYPGYSADFFDGKHFVMKGGSARTASCMLRRSFRNWFQPHYPYVYATFRCVRNGS